MGVDCLGLREASCLFQVVRWGGGGDLGGGQVGERAGWRPRWWASWGLMVGPPILVSLSPTPVLTNTHSDSD